MRRPGPRKWPILRVRTARLRISMDGAYFLFCSSPQNRKGIDSLAQLCQRETGGRSFFRLPVYLPQPERKVDPDIGV